MVFAQEALTRWAAGGAVAVAGRYRAGVNVPAWFVHAMAVAGCEYVTRLLNF